MKKESIVLVLCVVMTMLVAGCGKEVAVASEPASTSEVVSEEIVSEEVSEPASEEPSEVVSEEVSEEILEEPEIIDGVQTVYCESHQEMTPYFEEIEGPVIVIYRFSQAEKGQVLLYDGAHYTMNEKFFMRIVGTKEIEGVTTDADYVIATNAMEEEISMWKMGIQTTGTDIEVPLTIFYSDGTQETLTVYITKEWE